MGNFVHSKNNQPTNYVLILFYCLIIPFIPFHMGAGVVGKAVLDGRISFISFGVAQVLIDIEPGMNMLFGWGDLHCWSHALTGAIALDFDTNPLLGLVAPDDVYALCAVALGWESVI